MVEVGKYYHLRDDNPNSIYYPFARVLEIIPPHSGINKTGAKIAKCEWTVSKNDTFGLIKYFRVSSLILAKEE